MKTTGELRRLINGLTHDNINNYQKLLLLHAERQGNGRHVFPEKESLVLEMAFPDCKHGMKPSAAFQSARARYEEVTDEIREAIFEYTDSHNGLAPRRTRIEQKLVQRTPAPGRFIDALLEEHQIVERGGTLSALPVFSSDKLLASTTVPKPAYLMLSKDRKTALREMALSLYLAETGALPVHKKIPVPVEGFIERQGFSLEYRNLARGHFGYNDPSMKRIIISTELAKDSGKMRLVMAHECFHILLEHGTRKCGWDDNSQLEAEATYAAIHYLIPLHTFAGVLEQWKLEEPKLRPPLELRIADEYHVSRPVGVLYLEEQGIYTPQSDGSLQRRRLLRIAYA
jgi:hypothetical protein